MQKSLILIVTIIVLFALTPVKTPAQQFPIAVGPDSSFGAGGAFDGSRFLLALLETSALGHNLSFQFITDGGALSGSRVSLGKTGGIPYVQFDGTNYLMVWSDQFPLFAGDTNGIGNIYGQFISPSGTLVGNTFTFATGVNIKFGQGRGALLFKDNYYQLIYCKGGNHHDVLYFQKIDKSGTLAGSPVQVSSGYARELSAAYDGVNYLIAWCDGSGADAVLYGQFISPVGVLSGSNFVIDNSPNKSDNPTAIAYDDSRYFIVFHDQTADSSSWNIYGRFITPLGTVFPDRILIADSTKNPTAPQIATDMHNYLVTWIEFGANSRIAGRHFNKSGVPLDSPFTICEKQGNKFPVGGVGSFLNGKYILSATMLDSNMNDGDVYGLMLEPFPTGINDNISNTAPDNYALMQNYPNPFNPSTTIPFNLSSGGKVSLTVYDLLGRTVDVLINNEQMSAGTHSVKWNAQNRPAGIYFYKLNTGSFSAVKKLVLLK
jgi:hypothetical protein